ncbi:MAG: hypothetical protein ACYDCI_00005 [Candidatus Limnocylindrales bacterium]
MTANDFARMTSWDLVTWLGSYSGRQAGYYPGLRRTRRRAEAEAAARNLAWWKAQTYYTDGRGHLGLALDQRLVPGITLP